MLLLNLLLKIAYIFRPYMAIWWAKFHVQRTSFGSHNTATGFPVTYSGELNALIARIKLSIWIVLIFQTPFSKIFFTLLFSCYLFDCTFCAETPQFGCVGTLVEGWVFFQMIVTLHTSLMLCQSSAYCGWSFLIGWWFLLSSLRIWALLCPIQITGIRLFRPDLLLLEHKCSGFALNCPSKL